MDRLEKEYFDVVRRVSRTLGEITSYISQNPDQEHPQVGLRHALGGFDLCYMR